MTGGNVWWGQIGNSLRLLTQLSNCLRDCRSVVLQAPQGLPWKQIFYETLDLHRSDFSSQRRLKRLPWEEGADPGEFVLDELCSRKVQADYWPGKTYGEYLGSREDLILNDYYVWITGIRSKTDLTHWVEFLTQYHRAGADPEQQAVFCLEYTGAPMEVAGLENLVYSVERYDCRVFCLEAAAALKNTDLRTYQAEMALSIAGADPELCFALLNQGMKLLYQPVQTAVTTAASGCYSSGALFPVLRDQQATVAAREAALVLLFPILERYRMGIIEGHSPELARHLPITNSNGDRVTDVWDLEIGQLLYIVSTNGKGFSQTEVETIRLCRNVRNQLAHNKPVRYEQAKAVFALGK